MRQLKNSLFAITIALSSYIQINAQIQTTSLPEAGFEARIEIFVNEIKLIDTHEHLITEEERIAKADQLDFTYLFSHYTIEDLISSSNMKGIMDIIFSDDFPLEERWELFKPFFKETRNTAYTRATMLAARDIYGIDEINDDTYAILSEKIRENSKPGLYKSILQDKAGIELSIIDGGHRKFDTTYYRHVERFDNFIQVSSKTDIIGLGSKYGITVNSMDDYLSSLRKAFLEGVDYNMVSVKSALAYQRILKFNNTSTERAQTIFKSYLNDEMLSASETKAFQDFMMHRVLDLAKEFDLPIQIHTGLQAGNGNDITNSNPTHLINLFMSYPEVNFCIFHSSYPYGGELSVLAKNFPNVFIDMTWTPVISPSYSIRYLHEWLETVPANKIMVFGGDYLVVELAYAHSVFAREIVTKVLIEKVRTGYFSEEDAKYIALKILRNNALEIFKLKGHSRGAENIEALKRPGRLHDWWEIHSSEQGIIRDWMVVGPFPFAEGLDGKYPPEAE
ncbi:MAG: amidohydrolase family protein, partial [Bacteroidales bacterium]|nr:amidohydrolase family protein [Bacteroidales bacterium]